MASKNVILSSSGVTIEVTEKFDKDSASDFLTSILQDEEAIKSYRADPARSLGNIGININSGDLGKITPEDLQTIKNPGDTPQALAAVAVAVAVFCYPSKTIVEDE
ncbi:hypothetical protein ACM78Z_27230 [Pseudomonas aeruginosa]